MRDTKMLDGDIFILLSLSLSVNSYGVLPPTTYNDEPEKNDLV